MKRELIYAAVVGGVVGALLTLVLGMVVPIGAQSEANTEFDKITCRELEVVDWNGRVAIGLYARPDGNGGRILVFGVPNNENKSAGSVHISTSGRAASVWLNGGGTVQNSIIDESAGSVHISTRGQTASVSLNGGGTVRNGTIEMLTTSMSGAEIKVSRRESSATMKVDLSPSVELSYHDEHSARMSVRGSHGGELRFENKTCSATLGYEREFLSKDKWSPFLQLSREGEVNEDSRGLKPGAYMILNEIGIGDSRSKAAMTVGNGKAKIWSSDNYFSR